MTSTETSHQARCLRPGCGRKLTSARSIARGMGEHCARQVRRSAVSVDLSEWTPSQVEAAIELIEDGGIVPAGSRPDVFRTVASDGEDIHVTTPKGCNCEGGMTTRPKRPCYHRCAAVIVQASLAKAA